MATIRRRVAYLQRIYPFLLFNISFCDNLLLFSKFAFILLLFRLEKIKVHPSSNIAIIIQRAVPARYQMVGIKHYRSNSTNKYNKNGLSILLQNTIPVHLKFNISFLLLSSYCLWLVLYLLDSSFIASSFNI